MVEQMQSLDFQLIERASEKYTNIKEAVIYMEIDGEVKPFIVEIYKHFSPVNIKMMVQELIEKLDLVRSKKKNSIDALFVPYMLFLTIKHFTTLELPNEFAEQLKAIEHMTNTGTMFQIIMHIDQDEIKKVKEEIDIVAYNLNSNLAEVDDFKKMIQEKLVDKSLLE